MTLLGLKLYIHIDVFLECPHLQKIHSYRESKQFLCWKTGKHSVFNCYTLHEYSYHGHHDVSPGRNCSGSVDNSEIILEEGSNWIKFP